MTPCISPSTPTLLWESLRLSGVWRIIFLSNRKELVFEDLAVPLTWFRASGTLEADAIARWRREAARDRKGRLGWRLLFSQMSPIRSALFWGVFCSGLQGALATVGRFMVLRTIIQAARREDPKPKLAALAVLFFFIALLEGVASVLARQLIAGHFIHTLMARNNALLMSKVGRVAAATSTSATDRSAVSMPSLSALYAADMPRMLSFIRYLSLLACGLVSLVGGTVVVAVFLGLGAVVALGCMLLFGMMQQYYTVAAKKIEHEVFESRDKVVNTIRQAIKAAKAVKFYAWEDQYAALVKEKRAVQAGWMVKYRTQLMVSISTGKTFPVVATVATLVVTASRRGNFRLDAEDAFSAVAVFQTIRVGMIIVPLSRVLLNTFVAIHDRIGAYLLAPEDDLMTAKKEELTTTTTTTEKGGVASVKDLRATLGGGGERSEEDLFRLSVADFEIGRGELVALVGQVGSGKTAFAHAFLGRLEHTGSLAAPSIVGYAPQEPFVVSGTIRENVVMGRDFDEAAFQKAIAIASFARDVDAFSHGVDTIIGERGTTLSGGQQARLQVARAAYGDPELMVLDSSLAAVDARVAREMFDSLRRWVTRDNKAVILVLSQLHFLPQCDRTYVLEGGAVVASGTASELADKEIVGDDFLAHLVTTLRTGADSDSIEEEEEEEDEVLTRKAAFITEKTVRKIDALTPRKKNEDAVLVKKETIRHGTVSLKVFRAWARGVGYGKLAGILAIFYVGAFAIFASDVILSQWTRAKTDRMSYMLAYAVVGLFQAPCLLVAAVAGVKVTVAGANEMHATTFDTVLRAPVGWFESVPSGRIVSRFAADFDIVDIDWAQMLDGFTTMFTAWTMFIFAICLIVPVLIPINALLFYGLVSSIAKIDVANRDLKRIANAAVSPCVTNAQEAETGRVVAGAIGASEFFRERQRRNMDGQLSAFFASTSVHQAAYLNATVWCSLMSFAASMLIVLVPEVALSDRSVAPVALTYALVAPYFASMASEIVLQLSLYATSLERLFEYLPNKADGGGVVPREPPHVKDSDSKLPSNWPARGAVVFENVQLRYRDGLPLALKDASFEMAPSDKVGVVGRTGAGKSSLFIALFRLVDVCGGRVLVDGVDTSTLGLTMLRRRLCLIPQDAVLMQGTGKMNCDPFDEYSDEVVGDAIETVGLPRACLDQTLVTNDGDSTSLSAGERQLLALARCLLRRSSVVCFDEATAHVDANTDVRIQNVIAEEFLNSSLLVIAHRLHTVIGNDKLIVMKDGVVAQSGPPLELLAAKEGPFADMCAALGDKAVQDLTAIATDAATHKKKKSGLVAADVADVTEADEVVIDVAGEVVEGEEENAAISTDDK